jgi:hypothetical protein
MSLQDETKKRMEEKPNKLEMLIEANEKRKKINEKVGGVFSSFFKILPIILINVFGAIIIGLDNFVEGSWSWAIFGEASFWYSYASFQTANWLIVITYFVNAIKKLKTSVPAYVNGLNFIQEMVNDDHKEEFIQRQVEIEDLRRKKETLERRTYSKMYKIKTRNKIKSLDAFLAKDLSTIEGKRKKRAHRQLTNLNEMLTLEWQKLYLKSYDMKYVRVTRGQIVSGVHVTKKEGDHNDYKTRIIGTSFRSIAPSALASSLIGLVLLSFQFFFKEFTVYTALKFTIQIFLITWNTVTVMTLVYTIFTVTYLNSVEERRGDIGLFKKRHENKNKGMENVVDILEYEKGEN